MSNWMSLKWILAGRFFLGPIQPIHLSVQNQNTMLWTQQLENKICKSIQQHTPHHIPFGIFWDILWCSPLLLAIYDLPKRCHPNHPTLRKTSNTFVQKTRLAESPLHKVSWSKPQKMPSRIFIPAPPVSWAIVGITKTTQRPIYSWYIFFLMI